MKIQYPVPFTIIDRAVLMSEELSVYDKTVYAILCAYANSTDRSCFPSYKTIARKSGCSRRKVIAVVANLERLGLVEKQEQRNAIGDNTSNLYIVKPMPSAGGSPPNAHSTP
jgi:ribosomal protein S19E (S16A)